MTRSVAKLPGLTVPETARRLGIGIATAWRWIAQGRLRVVRYGGARPQGGVTRVPFDALRCAPRPLLRGRRASTSA